MTEFHLQHAAHLPKTRVLDLYHLAQVNGVADAVFYDGGVSSTMAWAEYIRTSQAWLVACFRKGETVGFWWLNGFIGRTAMIHFCFWDLGLDDAVRLGRQSLHWLFEQGDLDSVYGVTPKHYRHVFPFILRAGFTLMGEVPGACYLKRKDRHVPGVLSVCVPEGVPK